MEMMAELKRSLILENLSSSTISIGDTPGCMVCEKFEGTDEIRPGNFVFFDLMQHRLGVCELEDIALTVKAPVIGIYPERGQFVVHSGGVHFSKEYLLWDRRKIFGISTDGKAKVVCLSQEHGTVAADDEYLKNLSIGQMVEFYPVHACMTANLFDRYHTKTGEIIEKRAACVDN